MGFCRRSSALIEVKPHVLLKKRHPLSVYVARLFTFRNMSSAVFLFLTTRLLFFFFEPATRLLGTIYFKGLFGKQWNGVEREGIEWSLVQFHFNPLFSNKP